MELVQFIEEEPLSERIIRAICQEDLEEVKTLLKPDIALQDLKGSNDDTLIHIVVRRQNVEILEYILDLQLINIDAFNAYGRTPLLMAAAQESPEITKMLIEKGADLNLADKDGNSPLHISTYYKLQQNCVLLLENGANVNAQNKWGFTVLHSACGGNNVELELVAMLMCYGADVGIPSWREDGWGRTPFESCLFHNKVQFQHFLIDFVFDGIVKVPILLEVLMEAMEYDSPLLPHIIDNISEIVFDQSELAQFFDRTAYFNTECLRIFFQKFNYVFVGVSSIDNRLANSIWYCYPEKKSDCKRMIDNLYVVFQEPVVPDFVEEPTDDDLTLLSILIKMGKNCQVPLKVTEEIFFHVLSYGGVLTDVIMDKIYHCFGECEFFRTLLFMDIKRDMDSPLLTPFPAIIFMMDLDFSHIHFYLKYDCPSRFCLYKLLELFTGVRVKKACFRTGKSKLIAKAMKAPDVPSLLEFARNSARNHIIKYYGISTSRQFCEVLKLLHLCEVYRDILTFKKKIYLA